MKVEIKEATNHLYYAFRVDPDTGDYQYLTTAGVWESYKGCNVEEFYYHVSPEAIHCLLEPVSHVIMDIEL